MTTYLTTYKGMLHHFATCPFILQFHHPKVFHKT